MGACGGGGGGGGGAAFKWAAVAEVLAAGSSPSSPTPLPNCSNLRFPTHRDSDVKESRPPPTTWQGTCCPSWLRWGGPATRNRWSYRRSAVLGYFAATHEAVQLAKTLAARLGCERPPCDVTAGGTAEAYALTEEVAGPAYEGVTRAGVSFRLLSDGCFGTGGGSVGRAPALSDASRSHGANPNAILSSRAFDSREQTLAHGWRSSRGSRTPNRARSTGWCPPRWPGRRPPSATGSLTGALCDGGPRRR